MVLLSVIARRLMRSKVSLLLAGALDHALPGRVCLGLAFAYLEVSLQSTWGGNVRMMNPEMAWGPGTGRYSTPNESHVDHIPQSSSCLYSKWVTLGWQRLWVIV